MSELEIALDRCRAFLVEVDEPFWSEKISRAMRTYQGDEVGLSRTVSGWIGSMGSFSDLMIHPLNGHNVRPEEARAKNDHLIRLRGVIYGALLPPSAWL